MRASLASPDSERAARKEDRMTDHTRARVELAVRFLWPIVIVFVFIGLFYLSFRRG